MDQTSATTTPLINLRDTKCLQRRADEAGQSMQEYLLALLREHVDQPTMGEWLAEAGSDSGGHLPFDDAVRWQRTERETL